MRPGTVRRLFSRTDWIEFMTASKSGMSGFHFGSGVCFTWCFRFVFKALI
jgi:hypothetical protein